MHQTKIKDIKNLPPIERIKLLKKITEKRKKEIEEAEKLIKESIEEAKRDKEKKVEPIEEVTRELVRPIVEEAQEDTESLELKIAKEKAKTEETSTPLYGRPIEEIKENLYALATPNVYRSISQLLDIARERALTEEEERRVDFYRKRMSEFATIEHYITNPETKRFLLSAEEALIKIKKYELRRKEKEIEDKRGY